MKKTTIALMLLILLSSVYATYDLKILITNIEENDSLDLRNIQVIEQNPYYLAYSGNQEYNRPFRLEFLDMSGNLILKSNSNYPPFTEINYTPDFSKIEKVNIYRNDTLLYSKPITLCNNNGLCEPCTNDNCEIFENEIVCGDCEPSSLDGFCRIEDDNICDPDCTGYFYDIPPEGCFEDTLDNLGCSFYDMLECSPDETCIGPQNTGNITCCNECLKDNLNVKENTCNDFDFFECSGNEFCDKDELTLFNNQTCCTGKCQRSDYYDKNILDSNTEQPLSIWVVIAFAVFALLILFLGKKKLVHIAIFSIIMMGGIYVASINGSKITGRVAATQDEQMQKICEVAKAYDLPGSMLLTIAYKESQIKHYDAEGKVKVSYDGGVGIMQIDRGYVPYGEPFNACGKSRIDGRELDAWQLVDNIECGALEIWEKCGYFDCLNSEKKYYCPNDGTGIPAKNVVYKGWDIALRGYNGWGCNAYDYMNLWGARDPRYIDLIMRIQSYVEDFHTLEDDYKSTCSDDVPTVTPPETQGFDRKKIAAYAKEFATKVVDDGCFFTNSESPECSSGMINAGATAPSNYISGSDCAHFASYSLKQGGLTIDCRYNPSTCIPYGEPGAQRLKDLLISKGIGIKVESSSKLDIGDLIFYDWDNNAVIDHVAVYIGNNQVASHTSNGIFDWNMGHPDATFTYLHLIESSGTSEPDYSSIPEELLKGDKMGYYYLNPSFTVHSKIDLKKIDDELRFSEILVSDASACVQTGASYRDCVIKVLSENPEHVWYLDGCPGEQYTISNSNMFKFCVDSGYKKLSGSPLYLRFALTINDETMKRYPEFSYDIVEDRAAEPSKSSTPAQNANTDNAPEVTVPITTPAKDTSEVESNIKKIMKDCYGAASFRNLDNKEEIKVNENSLLHSMSMFKGPLSVYYYMSVPEEYWPDAARYITGMINVSDNYDTSRVFSEIEKHTVSTEMEGFNRFLQENGLSKTFVSQFYFTADGYTPKQFEKPRACTSAVDKEGNQKNIEIADDCEKAATASEMVMFYEKLYNGDLTYNGLKITDTQKAKALETLKRAVDFKFGIADAISHDILYSKGGSYAYPAKGNDWPHNVYTDSGIIIGSYGKYAYSILLMDCEDDFGVTAKKAKDVAKEVENFLTGSDQVAS
ncbi:MAG: NlpC/P60 family protein [archaeon]